MDSEYVCATNSLTQGLAVYRLIDSIYSLPIPTVGLQSWLAGLSWWHVMLVLSYTMSLFILLSVNIYFEFTRCCIDKKKNFFFGLL